MILQLFSQDKNHCRFYETSPVSWIAAKAERGSSLLTIEQKILDYMKNILIFLSVWGMMSAWSAASAQVFKNDDLTITSLGDRMWVVETTDKTTMYLIEGDEKALLIDDQTGSCFSGDAFGSGHVWLQLKPYAPMQSYINSLKKMTVVMDKGITKLYCGHYPYIKKTLGKDYILAMLDLAQSLDNGTAPPSKPFDIKVSIGCENPMIVSKGPVSIVYDPEHLK